MSNIPSPTNKNAPLNICVEPYFLELQICYCNHHACKDNISIQNFFLILQQQFYLSFFFFFKYSELLSLFKSMSSASWKEKPACPGQWRDQPVVATGSNSSVYNSVVACYWHNTD